MAGYSNQLQDIRNLMFAERNWWRELNKVSGHVWACVGREGLDAWHEQLGTEAVLGFVVCEPWIIDDHNLSKTIPYLNWCTTFLAQQAITELK